MIRQVQLRLVLYSKTVRAKKNWTKTWRARANDGFFSSVSSPEKPLRHLPDSPRSSEYAKGDRCESHVGRGEKRSLIGRGNGVPQPQKWRDRGNHNGGTPGPRHPTEKGKFAGGGSRLFTIGKPGSMTTVLHPNSSTPSRFPDRRRAACD